MVGIWYMDDSLDDQRNEHILSPDAFISPEKLQELTGVEYFKIQNVNNLKEDSQLNILKEERQYNYEDEITCSKACLPNYEEKEHLHTDEEIRLVLDGSGYFDVRDVNDKWIRIKVEKGDLIVIPKGIYHRFTLDLNNFIKAKRFFVGEPVWTPFNRPADNMDCRVEYLKKMKIASS